MEHGMGQGSNPDVQHAHRAWQKDLPKVARIFHQALLGFCKVKHMSPFHISIFSKKRSDGNFKISRCAGSKRMRTTATVAIVMESPLSDMTWASFLLCNGPSPFLSFRPRSMMSQQSGDKKRRGNGLDQTVGAHGVWICALLP